MRLRRYYTLINDGHNIPWKEFIFEETRRDPLVSSNIWHGRNSARPFAAFVTPLGLRTWQTRSGVGQRVDCRPDTINGREYGIDLFSRTPRSFNHIQINEPHLVIAGNAWIYEQRPAWIGIEIVEPAQISM
jgi:hypothetical protein